MENTLEEGQEQIGGDQLGSFSGIQARDDGGLNEVGSKGDI